MGVKKVNISILGLNIKRIREEKGISAYKLAKEAEVGASTISQIESGKRQSLNTSTIEKIANVLEVSTDELLSTEPNTEYIIADIEQTIRLVLSSDELVLDDIEMTNKEKEQFLVGTNAILEIIRLQRGDNDEKGGTLL